jgi:hypothetical protein
MPFFGDFERFVSEDLYPYRWLITIGLIAVAAAALVISYRMRWHLVVWRHKLASGLVAAVVLAVAVPAGDYLLSPLWERSFLEEQSPLALALQNTPGDATATPRPTDALDAPAGDPAATFQPRVTHRGEISGADDFHFGRGDALLIEVAPGRYTLRFEDFSVRNGPDLFVYLTADAESVGDAINLGELKATDGAFNYDVPEGTDVSRYRYAIVWCRDFAVVFASAPLAAVG